MGMFSMSKGEGLAEGREIVKTAKKPAPVVPSYEEPTRMKTEEELEQEFDWFLEACGMSRESLKSLARAASEIR